MTRKAQQERPEETRLKLLRAGREAFGQKGFAQASMDDLTASQGLTRGALYHHFGSKEGLLGAVVREIDLEICQRLGAEKAARPTAWDGFVAACLAYIDMAQEPEIQRILLRDGPAVLDPVTQWPGDEGAVRVLTMDLEAMRENGGLVEFPPEATARIILGAIVAGARWIANSDNQPEAAADVKRSITMLLNGLIAKDTSADGTNA